MTVTHPSLAAIEDRLAPLRSRLTAHPLYGSMKAIADVRTFMESHIFAVWDFMSLLKALQRGLTSVEVPWVPSSHAASCRFVNEIVLGEESDEFHGEPLSHFEIYLRAMDEAGADTAAMRAVVGAAQGLRGWKEALDQAPQPAADFVRSTFAVIEGGSLAAQAAAFTFGREDVLPDLFRGLVKELNREHGGQLSTFLWYLERHIEVDGEDHGPLSLRMVSDVCGDEDALWQQASDAAEAALTARLALWDGILAEITSRAS